MCGARSPNENGWLLPTLMSDLRVWIEWRLHALYVQGGNCTNKKKTRGDKANEKKVGRGEGVWGWRKAGGNPAVKRTGGYCNELHLFPLTQLQFPLYNHMQITHQSPSSLPLLNGSFVASCQGGGPRKYVTQAGLIALELPAHASLCQPQQE